MSTFTDTFDKTEPDGSESAYDLDKIIRQEVKRAMDERFELEHYGFEDASGSSTIENANAFGRHRPGLTSVVYINTNANILTLTDMHDGALAYDTDNGNLLIYDESGASWATYPISASESPQVATATTAKVFLAYRSTGKTLSKGIVTDVQANTEAWDYAGEYDNATFRYTPGVRGVYQFNFWASVAPLDSDDSITSYLYINSSLVCSGSASVNEGGLDTGVLTSTGSVAYHMTATDYAQLYCKFQGDQAARALKTGLAYTGFSGYLIGTHS